MNQNLMQKIIWKYVNKEGGKYEIKGKSTYAYKL